MSSNPNSASAYRSDSENVKATSKVTIAIDGARDAEAALTVVRDLLKPEIADALLNSSSGAQDAIRTDSNGQHMLAGWICCNWGTGTYSWCPGDPSQGLQWCTPIGKGCPA